VRDSAGTDGFLVLYSRMSPDDMLAKSVAEWRVALLSAAYRPEADVAFQTQLPAASLGSWKAFQTALELRDGQPFARIRYLRKQPALIAAPAAPNSAPAGAYLASAQGAREFDVRVSLNLASSCLGLPSVDRVSE
jgi:hypothetical protein